MTVQSIQKEALKLDARSRAKLAGILLSSLDDLSEDENERLWAEEAIRRHEEVERGSLRTKPVSTVIKNARSRVQRA